MARQRYVYPTGEIPHKWAHQTQESARNPQGNLYFRGDTIYSYRDSWPLARIFKHPKRGALVLCNSDRYSVTTAQHQSAVNGAARHMRRIAVPDCTRTDSCTVAERDASNVRHLEQLAAEHLAKAQRAMQARTVSWRRDSAQQALADAADYRRFFGMRGKIAEMPTAAWDAALARALRIENPDPASADARQRAAAKRKVKARAALQAEFDAYCAQLAEFHAAAALARAQQALPDPAQYWRDTGRWPAALEIAARPPYLGYKRERIFRRAGFDLPRYVSDDGRPDTVLLRVNGEQIETSQGARIPLSHAPRLWRIIEAVRASGQPYVRNGHTVHAGEFAIDRIDPDGTLRAGCHTIPHSELRIMARALGLPCEVQP
jgi:hypothetical protein